MQTTVEPGKIDWVEGASWGSSPPSLRQNAEQALYDMMREVFPDADAEAQGVLASIAERAVHTCAVFASKQHDYGPGNIAKAGELGVLIRTSDKIERLLNLRGKESKNEAKDDTWLDIGCYGLIGAVVREGNWPGVKPGWEL